MAKNIKWHYDKSDDFRGNHSGAGVFKIRVDHPYYFSFNACMTFKSFKACVKNFCDQYNIKEIWLLNTEDIADASEDNIILVSEPRNIPTKEYDELSREVTDAMTFEELLEKGLWKKVDYSFQTQKCLGTFTKVSPYGEKYNYEYLKYEYIDHDINKLLER